MPVHDSKVEDPDSQMWKMIVGYLEVKKKSPYKELESSRCSLSIKTWRPS